MAIIDKLALSYPFHVVFKLYWPALIRVMQKGYSQTFDTVIDDK